MDDITSLIDMDIAPKEVLDDLLGSSVYQGPHMLWVSSCRSRTSASRFEQLLPRKPGDDVKLILVRRDFGRFNRRDEPSKTPGGGQRVYATAKGD